MQHAKPMVASFKTREQAVYETLRQHLTLGRWAPEESLVVSRLAAELGVSRITVANALKRLSAEGFVRLTPHKEAVVARMTAEEMREIYLMRAELDALAAREAARHATPRDLERLESLNEELRRLGAEPDVPIRDLRRADHAFHRELRGLARMPRLAQALDNLTDQGEYYRARLLEHMRLVVPDAARHEPLLRALARHDADRAAEEMRQHVLMGLEGLLAAFRQAMEEESEPTNSREE